MTGLDRSDDELVELTARGDRAAFTALVARHRARLLALAARASGNRAIAEDIVQDVFVRAWINAPRWKARGLGRASYAAWLSRVALNRLIDLQRGQRERAGLDLLDVPADPENRPDRLVEAHERDREVERAIAALPERQRLAIGLTYDADLTNAEGAAAMGISVGAFELLLVRARRALRERLMDERA